MLVYCGPVSMHCGPPSNHHQAHTDLVYGCQLLATFIGLLNSELRRTKLSFWRLTGITS
jgi:hypothetical protein